MQRGQEHQGGGCGFPLTLSASGPAVLMQRPRAGAEAVKPRLRLLRAERPSALVTHTQAISFLSLPRPAASVDAPGGDRSPASRSDALCCPLSPLCAAKGHLTVPDQHFGIIKEAVLFEKYVWETDLHVLSKDAL